MNTLQIGCIAGLLLLEDVERNKTTSRKRRWCTHPTLPHRLSIVSYFLQQPQNISGEILPILQDVSYFFRRIVWFNRRKYCETEHHHEAEYSSCWETRNRFEVNRNWRLYTIL